VAGAQQADAGHRASHLVLEGVASRLRGEEIPQPVEELACERGDARSVGGGAR